jgi:hypothetical protein
MERKGQAAAETLNLNRSKDSAQSRLLAEQQAEFIAISLI